MPLAGHATGIPCASCAIGESHGYGTPVIDVNADVNAKALQELQIKQLDELKKIGMALEINNNLLQQLIAEQQNKEISNPKK
jgi:hypothetical protein